MSKERKVSKMTTTMFFADLKNEHLTRALESNQGLDLMYTFLIRDNDVRRRL